MPPLSQSTINNLPDGVLATILKLVADSPPFACERRLPFPVVAGRVSRRWRSVALGHPELWTTIRIFDISRSCHWAALFTQRSKTCPLDISINPSYMLLRDALAIVGPHIARWRTFALRGWPSQLREFRQFVLQSPFAPSRLESLHLDEVKSYDEQPINLGVFLAGGHLRSLRVATNLEARTVASFNTLHSLDIQCTWERQVYFPEFLHMLGSTPALTTLVLRGFYGFYGPHTLDHDKPHIIARSIRSLSIRFGRNFWCNKHGMYKLNLDTLTSRISFPNLESLEIVGGFSGNDDEEKYLRVPEPWEASPFGPHLRTLRLESVGFSRRGLAQIQSFSPDITCLHLIHITWNPHFIAQGSANDAWPALRALTVEPTGDYAPQWVAAFLATRAVHPQRRIAELTLSPWERGIALDGVPPDSQPVIYLQHNGPSSGLADSAFGGTTFYLDPNSMRALDFEDLRDVSREWRALDTGDVMDVWPAWWEEKEVEQEDLEIEERLRMRWTNRPRELWRYEVKQLTQEHKTKATVDLRKDFCVA
ncbi:hypothetical protein C8R46DRAFT_1287356 [Mycena filopes]|nr:hypothetical protein C8R46DRAFT_1287356 [Mycena filopes]